VKNKVYVIVGLGYGDEGKGTIVDFLTRQSSDTLIVRYNGGSQAAHNVVTPEGRHHTFSQFGSGMLVPDTITYLSEYMLVNPISLLNENEGLKKLGVTDALSRLFVHQDALITTPFHQAANRIKEAIFGDRLSGSCGRGIWETIADSQKFRNPLCIGDLSDPDRAFKKLHFIQFVKRLELSNIVKDSVINDENIQYELKLLSDPYALELCLEHYNNFNKQVRTIDSEYFNKLLNNSPQTIFEGAQGMLLDVNLGFNPYTTWTDITPHNAQNMLKNFSGKVQTVGILRSYTSRHGIGCFVSEDFSLNLPEFHNCKNRWQKDFRLGHLDIIATKYAIKSIGRIDFIAMTHLDYLAKFSNQVCCSYKYVGQDFKLLPEFFDLDQNNTIMGIKSCKPDEYSRQKLTNLLFNCIPNLVSIDSDYVSLIENELKVKISLISKGSTFLDKEWR
jgi:adenylosuccinate synthase